MKMLMIILLGLSGSPDPAVPQTVELDTPEACEDPGEIYDIVDYDMKKRQAPAHTRFCISGMAAEIDQHGNITPPIGAKAAFIAVYDKSRTDQKAGVQIFFTHTLHSCQINAQLYKINITNWLKATEANHTYPRIACVELQQGKPQRDKNGTPLAPTFRFIFGTDFQDPETAQYWTLPVEDLDTCRQATISFDRAFAKYASDAPYSKAVIRSALGSTCVRLFSIPQTLYAGPAPEHHARLTAIVTKGNTPLPGRRATLQFSVRNMEMCETAGRILQFDWNSPVKDAADAQKLSAPLSAACFPIRVHDWDK